MARSNIHLGVSGSHRQPEQMAEIIIHRQSSGEPRATCPGFSQWRRAPCPCAAAAGAGSGSGGAGRIPQVTDRSRCRTGSPEISPLPGGSNKARLLVTQTQFSAYRLQHIICLATAQRAETLRCLTCLVLLAASPGNVRRNP